MSVLLMAMAFRTDLPSTKKLVLLALCDAANDRGECYPSIPTLMEKCSLSERSIQGSIRDLEDEGYVRREFRAGRATVYWLTVTHSPRTSCPPHQVHPARTAEAPAPDAPPPPHVVPPTPAAGAPITIIESSVEPPKTRKRAPAPETVAVSVLVEKGFDEQTAAEFIAHKQRVKAPLTERAWKDHLRESAKAGWSPKRAAEKVMAKSWKGFESHYVAGERVPPPEKEVEVWKPPEPMTAEEIAASKRAKDQALMAIKVITRPHEHR